MKQVTIKQFIIAALGFTFMASCQKETTLPANATAIEQNESTSQNASIDEKTATTQADVLAAKTVTPTCSICDPKSTTFNLVDQLKTTKLGEGVNSVRDLGNGMRAVAQVQQGKITQWILQDKAGKTYLPKSVEQRSEQAFRPGGGFGYIFWICFITPYGWYCIYVIW